MRNRRVLLILILVALAGVLVLRFAFSGGGDDSSPVVAPTTVTTSSPANDGAVLESDEATSLASGTEAQPSSDTTSPFDEPESFDVFATRDPFEPVIQVPATTPPGQTPTTAPGTGPTDTSGGNGDTSGTTMPPSFDPGQREAVALLDVFVDDDGSTKARVQVGSTVFTVSEGQVFATSYQVVALDMTSGCGQFLFGDTPFELCEGEQVVK